MVGTWVRAAIPAQYLRWLLVASFFAVALWALKPDKLDAGPAPTGKYGAFAMTVVTFFIAEIGDKTQIATVMLAAQFGNLVAVVAGTTLGMLIADVPAVLIGTCRGTSASAASDPLRRRGTVRAARYRCVVRARIGLTRRDTRRGPV